jgi:hypothetical protein
VSDVSPYTINLAPAWQAINSEGERRRAVRAVASRATDAAELADLLGALGLTPEEGR